MDEKEYYGMKIYANSVCGGSGNGGSGKAEIKSVSLPEKLDGSVIKILAYDGWEQEHADIRRYG